VYHFSEAKKGLFYLSKDDYIPEPVRDGQPAFLRFAQWHGVADDLWEGEGISASEALQRANLAWPVHVRPVLVPSGTGGLVEARDYRALVRPDTEDVMGVVTTTFHVAENRWVMEATQRFSERLGNTPPIVGAVGFGRDHDRTLFIGRLEVDESTALCLLVYNQHSEGAIRFQLVEVNRYDGTVYAPASSYASTSIAHVGDVEQRLHVATTPTRFGSEDADTDEPVTFVERYRDDSKRQWARLAATRWTPALTARLVKELWGNSPQLTKTAPNGNEVPASEEAHRHPGNYLRDQMQGHEDAANAYRRICYYLDHESEACERGDFTKDRDQRLALGAGMNLKQRTWKWIIENT
jgi:hypothetical protein